MQTLTRRLLMALVAAGLTVGLSSTATTAHASDDTSWGQVKGNSGIVSGVVR